MEKILLELDRALDLALDRETAEAYRVQPLPADVGPSDAEGWDEANALAISRARARKSRLPSRSRRVP